MILAIGYWSLFLEFQGELQNDFDRSLYNYAHDLSQNAHLNSGMVTDLSYEVIFSADKIFPFPHGDTLVKIYHAPFKELFSFTTDKDAPKKLKTIENYIQQRKEHVFFDLTSEAGNPWRGLLMQFKKDPTQDIYFFVAVPRETLTTQENKFRSIFIAGQIVILVFSALMINVLAKNLLSSLETLTTSVRGMPIATSNFSFEVPDGPPEITLFAELLNRLIAQIQRSLLAHQEFVAKAAHQLKTPLTIAKGHLEQIDKKMTGETKKDLRVVQDEIDIMSGTITNLLSLVQIESGFQSVNLIEVDILDHILSEIDHLDFLARKKGLKFQIVCDDQDISPSAWITHLDPQIFSILLNNLIENAIKYASESPIELRVSLKGNFIILQLRNKMLPQEKPMSVTQLTDKYVRGDSPETGQGLGLYIAYKVANFLNINLNFLQEKDQFEAHLEIPKISLKEGVIRANANH